MTDVTPVPASLASLSPSRVMLLDEFENSRYRQEVLEMLSRARQGDIEVRQVPLTPVAAKASSPAGPSVPPPAHEAWRTILTPSAQEELREHFGQSVEWEIRFAAGNHPAYRVVVDLYRDHRRGPTDWIGGWTRPTAEQAAWRLLQVEIGEYDHLENPPPRAEGEGDLEYLRRVLGVDENGDEVGRKSG